MKQASPQRFLVIAVLLLLILIGMAIFGFVHKESGFLLFSLIVGLVIFSAFALMNVFFFFYYRRRRD